VSVYRWDEALAAYEGKLHLTQPSSQEYLTALLGKMRCLASLAEWEKLSSLCRWVRPGGGGGSYSRQRFAELLVTAWNHGHSSSDVLAGASHARK
jgi:hypothetical protein